MTFEMANPPVELVFHLPSPNGDDNSDEFASALRAVLDAASGELRLVSPYIGYKVLAGLISGREFRLITDLDACLTESYSGPLLELLIANAERVRHIKDVHAKVVLTDRAALVGSANLTENGIAGRDELSCLLRDSALVEGTSAWFEELWCVGSQFDLNRARQAMERGRDRAAERKQERKTKSPDERKRPKRSLGWLADFCPESSSRSPKRTARKTARKSATKASAKILAADTKPATAKFEVDPKELIVRLRTLASSQAEAIMVLEHLAEALTISGLSRDDCRLYVGIRKATALQVNISSRAVAWCHKKRHRPPYLGLLLDDDALAEKVATRVAGARLEKFNSALGIKIPLTLLAETIPLVQDSWHRAIRSQAARTHKVTGEPWYNPYRERYHQEWLQDVLMEKEKRIEAARLAFPSEADQNPSRGPKRAR